MIELLMFLFDLILFMYEECNSFSDMEFEIWNM